MQEIKKTVMISLLGGRPLPNILAAIHLKPDCLYIVASEDSIHENGNYNKAVNALPERLKPSERRHTVKPYDLRETIQQCAAIANCHPTSQIIIVSASEPKAMAFGAYDFVKQLKADGRDVDMCYVSGEGLVWLFTHKIDSLLINLGEYFASYTWIIKQKKNTENNRFKDLVALLIANLPLSHNLLRMLRHADRGKGRRTIKTKEKLDDAAFSLLKNIETLGIVSRVTQTGQETSWTVNSDEDARLLLTGNWLEYYLYQVASMLKDQKDKPLFDECAWGVEDQSPSKKGEIDFVGIFRGQLIIASCKTEDIIKRQWFEDLHSKAEQLGKGMCTRILVSSVSKQKQTVTDLQKWENWAQERQVVLVMAEDIVNMPDIFNKLVTGDNDAKPKHIPYYARI